MPLSFKEQDEERAASVHVHVETDQLAGDQMRTASGFVEPSAPLAPGGPSEGASSDAGTDLNGPDAMPASREQHVELQANE